MIKVYSIILYIEKSRLYWHKSSKVIPPYFSETNYCTLLALIKSWSVSGKKFFMHKYI